MNSLDVLYLSLAISVLAITGAVWFMVIKIGKFFKDIEPILRDMKDVTRDVKDIETTVRESVVIKGLGFISSLLKKK